MMKAILGLGDLKTNVNFPNQGQIKDFPMGSIVETNCIFAKDKLTPVPSTSLGTSVNNLVLRNLLNIESLYKGIKKRDFKTIYASFINQPLCSNISHQDGQALFKKMVLNTKAYLTPFYDLHDLDKLQ